MSVSKFTNIRHCCDIQYSQLFLGGTDIFLVPFISDSEKLRTAGLHGCREDPTGGKFDYGEILSIASTLESSLLSLP